MNKLPYIIELFGANLFDLIFSKLRKIPYSFLLDSAMDTCGGRFSFLGVDPFAVIKSKDGITTVEYPGSLEANAVFTEENPLEIMQNLLGKYKGDYICDVLPFTGGAVGFLGYDLGRQLERVPSLAVDDLQVPDLLFGLYDVILGRDNLADRTFIISTGLPEQDQLKVFQRAEVRARWLENLVHQGNCETEVNCPPGPVTIQANFNKQDYIKNVQRAIEHILDGDIFQVNLSQRFEVVSGVEGWQLYRDLKKISPAPFSAYMNFADIEVICSSPERFLKLDHLGRVETCPIKGTRPRGNTEAEDLLNYTQLQESVKDRAELTMIVDLERSDLGKVCRTGSVSAEMPFRIEKFPTVYHLVATVTGNIDKPKGIFDLLKASFPGGSITGAPKIKAMEIIERLEPVRRGIYTGSLGYIGFDGRADLNIVIRTIVKKQGKFYFQVGGGITAESVPESEYNETLDKARALLRALKFEGSIYHGPYVY